MNVLFLAAEAAPFASTGGLGEVIASLPLALDSFNVNCRVLLPAYKKISHPCRLLTKWTMGFDGKLISVFLKEVSNTELPLYLLDIPDYFERDQLYGYDDDILRFGAFCQATLLAQKYFCENDWQVDIIHCHDWHTALFPVYKSTFNAPGKVLLTIHNLAYQGVCDSTFLSRLGLPSELFNMHQLEFWGKLNPFKGGLVFADAISTVSPTYAKEIQTTEYGCGLEDILKERSNKLFGVINGIDQNTWDPQKDTYLKSNYSEENISGKAVCKQQLQELGNLKADSTIPLIGMVTRLTEQKGIDLLIAAFDKIMKLKTQIVILGDGEPEFIAQLKQFSIKYPEQVFLTTGVFDVEMAHQIYAGSDLFLMPSRFEPCGLAQMISMRYGTIPIVRATGGMADIVQHFSEVNNLGNGFVFESYQPDVLVKVIREAVNCFKDHHWKYLQQNAFTTNFSWQQSAMKYRYLYLSL
ncbi:MAG: glycogen synthase GlgA [Abditibacteriaceae bacterium]